MQFSLNIHAEFSLFFYMFFLVRGGGVVFGVLVLCFVVVRAEAKMETPVDGISASLVSISFQFSIVVCLICLCSMAVAVVQLACVVL